MSSCARRVLRGGSWLTHAAPTSARSHPQPPGCTPSSFIRPGSRRSRTPMGSTRSRATVAGAVGLHLRSPSRSLQILSGSASIAWVMTTSRLTAATRRVAAPAAARATGHATARYPPWRWYIPRGGARRLVLVAVVVRSGVRLLLHAGAQLERTRPRHVRCLLAGHPRYLAVVRRLAPTLSTSGLRSLMRTARCLRRMPRTR